MTDEVEVGDQKTTDHPGNRQGMATNARPKGRCRGRGEPELDLKGKIGPRGRKRESS